MSKQHHENTLRWIGKTGNKQPQRWTPHQGPYTVIKLPRSGPGSGITPPLTEEMLSKDGVRVDKRWDW